MARKPDMPSEFAHFLRDLGIRAFDLVASRLEEEKRADEGMVRKLARQWNTLPVSEKERFFGYVVSAAELAVAAAPALSVGLATAARARRAKRGGKSTQQNAEPGAPRRYYDPAEVEATLPAQRKKKKKADEKSDAKYASESFDESDTVKRHKKG
jgi:hypothetical protein